MSLRDNIMHVTTSNEISQKYRFLIPIVEKNEDIQKLLKGGHIEQWQAHLLWLIDIKKQSFAYIAKCTNCSRQNVHYTYLSIKRVAESSIRKSRN